MAVLVKLLEVARSVTYLMILVKKYNGNTVQKRTDQKYPMNSYTS